MHCMVITARIFLLSETHFFGTLFFFTSHFIPSGPILLSLYLYIFQLSCIFFFFNTFLFIFLMFFFFCSVLSFLISHLSPYLLFRELWIAYPVSISRTCNDCLFLVLPILFKRPCCLLKDDRIFQSMSFFVLNFSFRVKEHEILKLGLHLKRRRTYVFFFMWLLLNTILPSFGNDRKILLINFQLGRAPREIRIALSFIRTTGQGLTIKKTFWGSVLKEHSWKCKFRSRWRCGKHGSPPRTTTARIAIKLQNNYHPESSKNWWPRCYRSHINSDG